ncbi:glutathione S-transferase family protein [Caenimonas soli]|uniref:glutathione S-transferase family protein n=1 Tax=Caenimonas soli TaxID=2735555 RepID=UPI001554EC93|nr:glutathione S-transferase [Caenimonas soli]NPC58127.1 glutathione S-transferase [Caenimonas soli]
MLKIWGRISSINVRKVVLAAQWLGIPFERTDAGHEFGVVKTPEYLAKNPNALVPLIEDGDFQLWESNVIVRYLCAKHSPGELYPQDLAARFDAERWMDWQQTTLNPAGRNAFVHLMRTPAEKRDAQLVAQSAAATESLMTLLDDHLPHRAFMAGDAFTMADIPIACELHRWRGLPLERPARPHLERWYQGILAQPASRGVLDLPLS